MDLVGRLRELDEREHLLDRARWDGAGERMWGQLLLDGGAPWNRGGRREKPKRRVRMSEPVTGSRDAGGNMTRWQMVVDESRTKLSPKFEFYSEELRRVVAAAGRARR